MQGLFGWVLLSSLLIFTKTSYCQSKNIQGKGQAKRNPFKISYLLKPSISAIEVVCHAYLASTFQIICPLYDGKDLENNNFGASKAEGTYVSTDNYSIDQRCIRLIRRISWKQIGTDFSNFTCFCGVKLQGVEKSKNKVSVKIINQECKRNTKVFRRKINAEKNIHISCCITGQPPPEITWYKDEFELPMPNGSAVINNVRYQQKGDRLLISRTNVYGSGNYQCLARNSAGHDRGGTYQVIFYAFTHVETTKMATTFSSVGISSTDTSHEAEGNFLRNANETVDNKEEDEENEKQNEIGKIPPNAIAVLVLVSVIVVAILSLFAYERKKQFSSEGNEQRSTRAGVMYVDQNRKSEKTLLTADSIDEKLVNIHDEPETNFEESKRCPLPIVSSSTQLLSYLPTTSVINPYRQSIASTSSIDVAVETHLVHPNVLAPLVSTTPCSSSIEDIHDIFKEPCTFCPIHHMTETDLRVDNTEVFAANMPSPDLSTGSNTSELLDKLITVPPNADERYFASALIDHNGGEVVLTSTGIKLVIPEGAINEGKTEVVHLALLGNPEYAPKQKDDDTALTPVVMCGPHGLRFKKHVMLVLPHCVAVSDELEKNFRVLCSDTAPEIVPDWKEIFNNKDESYKEVFCEMGDQQFCLFLRHFSWYYIDGVGYAKKFSIAAYHTSLHQPNEEFKRVDEAEEKLQGTLCDGPKIKIFRQDGGDIKIKATQITEGWELTDQNIQTVDYKVLCSCLEGSPNRTYCFQHVLPRPEGISAKFTVFQEKCEFDSPNDISMSLHFESEIKRAQFRSTNNNNCVASCRHASIPSSSGFVGSGENTTSVAFIPTKLREDLIQMLDINMPGTENWEALAGHLGYSLQFIKWLKYTDGLRRTETLLMRWENDVNENPEDALASLRQILLKMKRLDAADKVQICLSKHSIRKETTV